MNILFYTYYDVSPQKGGTERITSTIAMGLYKEGINCFLAYDFDIDPNLERTYFDTRIKVGDLSKKTNANKFREFVLCNHIDIILVQGLFGKIIEIRRLLSNVDDKIRIVLAHHFNPGAEENFLSYNSLLNQIRVKPKKWMICILKILLFPILKVRYKLKLHKQYKQAYNAADKVVLLSDGFIDGFVEYAGLNDLSKFYVIHNALSFQTFYDMSLYEQKHHEVVIVSRLEERQKRISLALRIWQQIEADKSCHDWVLRIVGGGSDENKYRRDVEQMKLERVFFEGIKEPEPYYQTASIFLMTSSFEGWGLTLTEAQQYGVIPIAFNSYASLKDIITNEYNGYIIPNNNMKDYVDRLKLLMEDSDLRHQIAKNCIESSKRFEVHVICSQWIQLFKLLM